MFSVPSYVIPGTYAENLEFLRPIESISRVELLFFYYDSETEELLIREEEKIRSFHSRFTLTLHMPDSLRAEHIAIVERTSDFIHHYVLHPPESGAEKAFTNLLDPWRNRFGDRFLIENLIGRGTEWFFENTDLPLCLDTGHALLRGIDPAMLFQAQRERIREQHIHSVNEGVDHQKLQGEEEWLESITSIISRETIMNIELFSIDEVLHSIKHMRGFLHGTG